MSAYNLELTPCAQKNLIEHLEFYLTFVLNLNIGASN